MLLWRAATVIGVLTLLSASSSVDAADKQQKNKKKRGGLLGRVFRNLDNVKAGDEPLSEDEGYWERFLQATVDSIPSASPSAPPTPGPQCDVTVSITVTCQLLGFRIMSPFLVRCSLFHCIFLRRNF